MPGIFDLPTKSVRIASSGQVLNTATCSGVTTTTTTTTMPTYYYSATKCSDGTVVKIKEQSFSILPNGTIVKGVSGICYTITANVAFIATTDDISFVYSTCLECQGVTTTTTTSTTTSSTTTSSTTTTTTTTLPPLTDILVRSAIASGSVCSGVIRTYYISGPLSTVGTKVYYFNGTNYSQIDYKWLLQLGTSTAYEYDDGITGITYLCS
jgi:hypothetical protein